MNLISRHRIRLGTFLVPIIVYQMSIVAIIAKLVKEIHSSSLGLLQFLPTMQRFSDAMMVLKNIFYLFEEKWYLYRNPSIKIVLK